MPPSSSPFLHDRPLTETLVDWLGSAEREAALQRAPGRESAARATGLLSGEIGMELRAYFDRTTRQVQRYLNAPVALFSLIEGGCQTILSAAAPVEVPGELPADTSLCIHVRDSGRDLVIDDLTRSMFEEVAANATGAGVQAYLGTPVYAPSGEPIGSLCAIDMEHRSWEPNDLDLLKALAESLTDKVALLVRHTDAIHDARAVLAALPHAVLVRDGGGMVLSASPQAGALFGIEAESLLNGGLRNRVHPDDTLPEGAGTVELRGDDGDYRGALVRSVAFGAGGTLLTLTPVDGIQNPIRSQ